MITFLRLLLRLLYGYRTFNQDVLKAEGPVLLLPNHVSWWDWLLIGLCLEDDWRFVTSIESSETSWIHKRIMVNRRTFPVDMNSPYAVKRMAEYLQKGGRLVLFPEGRLSRTGSLMKIYGGTGFLIFKTGAKCITAYLRGAAQLPLSPNPNRKQWLPRVSVHFSAVLTPPKLGHVSVTRARTRLTEWLRERMVEQQFQIEMELGPQTVPSAIIKAAARQPRRKILQDATMQKMTYRRLLVGAHLLNQQWAELLSAGQGRVGILLPNALAMPVALLSLWAANKVPAILNYTTGSAIMLSCVRLAGLKQIVTSRLFVERAKLDLEPFQQAGIQMIFLEDVRQRISLARKLYTAITSLFGSPLRRHAANLTRESPAVILFTSGSEGEPKAVELTHRNLLANISQMLAVIDLVQTDRFFNALPLFHCFGLTVALLLPLVHGAFVFLYLSPLHYRVVPVLFYDLDCTIFFGTNTFLNGYARKGHPYEFHKLRYLFAGAEKLQESTATTWMQKFGVRVLEGYGATECSPCVSVNLPMHPRQGSAGQFLPGIEYRLEPVEGVSDMPKPEQGELVVNSSPAPHPIGQPSIGRLFVRGPNIMRGYLNPDADAKFQQLGGWYDTGDIVKVDPDGFVFVLGRLKRFAKISGEMVSLTAVEDALAGAFPQYGNKFAAAVVAKPDEDKGERLVAATNEPRLTLEQLRAAIRARGLGNLSVPREIKVLPEIPLLGTGKVNHRELEKLV